MEKKSKFQPFQKVIISGNFTGLGDLKAVIYEVIYYQINDSFYYQVSSLPGEKYFVHENFLSL